MRYISLFLLICVGRSFAQFPGSPPWGQGIGGRPVSGKPNRPSPFGSSSSTNSKQTYSSAQYDDPIPSNSRLDSTYDTQQLPAKLPILAPNGVVEIYNRVVDDLLKRLQVEFRKREIDPMDVLIRPTPAGPVRVPGHLQKRPFRRPGAALYRAGLPILPPVSGKKKLPSSGSSTVVKLPIKRKARADENLLPPSVRFPIDRPHASSGEEQAAAAGEGAEVKASFRGAGKISKGPLGEDDEKDALLPETTTVFTTTTTAAVENKTVEGKPTEAPAAEVEDSSEEDEPFFSRARSDEDVEDDIDLDLDVALDEVENPDDKDADENKKGTAKKETPKKEGTDEEEDEDDLKDKIEGSKDVETLLQRYQNKNTDKVPVAPGIKQKYTGVNKKKEEKEKLKLKNKNKQSSKESPSSAADEDDDEDDFDNSDASDEDDFNPDAYHDDHVPGGIEPGTLQSAGNRPSNGYYPPGGPPAVPAKPNAQLTGLSKMRRANDVSVSVDARSAVITARLLVGPLNVVINESVEPLERNVRATIPELEAEILLMERHGVVFLQRFTLDRAYGQDVEISIPKIKGDLNKKKKGNSKLGGSQSINGGGPPLDNMHAGAQQRYQTKMAAHISMEIVKLLRSGNLRVNLMRTAQSSMSKLKLPIQKVKKSKKKSKKSDKNSKSNISKDNDD